jgi:ATP-dependent DNA helicase RecQ
VVSVLLGRTTEKVTQWRHDGLPTFGIGADRSEGFWRGVIRQLIARGVMGVDVDTGEGRFSTLSLVSDKARPILRGEERVILREDSSPVQNRKRGFSERVVPLRPGRRAKPPAPEAVDEAGFEALRVWRAVEARVQKVPPYVIFHDSVLRDIAAVRPASLDEMGQIKGVGASKLARYGAAVLAVVRAA